jgi:transcriptional regulator with XRE-family HTH domain
MAISQKQFGMDKIFSMGIVNFLRKQGYNLKQIGELIGHSESYISRVSRGERAFTVEHFALIEKQLGKPLPMLLLEAIDEKNVDKQLRPLYKSLKKLLAKDKSANAIPKRAAAG